MPIRHTQRIELGQHLDRVGFVMHFDHGESETHLFDLATFEDLCRQGLALVQRVQAQDRQNAEERLGVHDQATLRLVSE